MNQKILRTGSIFILAFFLYSQNGVSLSIKRESFNKTETTTPDYLKGSVFINLTARDFEAATGKKLNLFQKIYFKIIQRQVKRDLKKNPELLITDYFDQGKVKFKFNALWFVIGAFIGPLGVFLSYFSHQQKNGPTKKDRTTSAWLGFAFFVLWFGYIFIF